MPSDSSFAAAPSAAARWTPPAVWVVLILVATSWPGGFRIGSSVPGIDKAFHFSAYAVLAALMLRATLSPTSTRTMLLVWTVVACFGALDEWHQQFIPRRAMSLDDWIADISGALVGVLAVRFLPFLTPRRRPTLS